MRNIKAGRDINVDGDFIINDSSQQYKLLSQCSNEELLAEELTRWRKLSEERKDKLNSCLTSIAFAASLIFIAGIWFWFQGKMDTFSLATGIAGFMISISSLKIYERPTKFEQRQLLVLSDITMLLRERDVR